MLIKSLTIYQKPEEIEFAAIRLPLNIVFIFSFNLEQLESNNRENKTALISFLFSRCCIHLHLSLKMMTMKDI